MLQALRRFVVLLFVAAIAGGALLTFTTKPKLDRAEREVASTWQSLRTALGPRYTLLRKLDTEMTKTGRTAAISQDLSNALQVWYSPTQPSVDTQVRAANTLETLGARYTAIVAESPRFSASTTVVKTANQYQATQPAKNRVAEFASAVEHANGLRDGFLRTLVANGLGHSDHPLYAG